MNEQQNSRASTSELQRLLERIHSSLEADHSGALADYIPELAKVNADDYGLAVATTSGKLFCVGDSERHFTIQSISKAFTYCTALELSGRQAVLQRVGVEPSGDAFNAIEFDPQTRRPFNPMVNAGAITVAGILYDCLGENAFEHVLDRLGRAAGRQLDVDEAVYESEALTGHRNRAIAHLLLASGTLTGPVDPIVNLYFRQCSIRVTARDLAWMGATLGNFGENPLTGNQVFDLGPVRDTLSVMFTCGMYNYSGNWAFDVGIPAKSGVGGGLVGVVNRQLGIGSYSPRLDAKGNSVRGVKAFAALSEEIGLHAFECTNLGPAISQQLFR